MSAQSFVQPPQGRVATGCASVLIGLPVVVSALALSSESPALATIPVVVGCALLAAAYYVFNEEVRVDLDARGLRLSRVRVILGLRLTPRVEWEILSGALTRVREVRRRTPAREGGWNRSTVLELPEGRALDARELGGSDDPGRPYGELVRALERQLGEAFERPPEIT